MPGTLAYVLVTPYSLLKSRTGGIIGRLLFLTDLELVGARMYCPSDEFVDRYIETVRRQKPDKPFEDVLVNYVNDHFRPDNRLGISNRTMLLLFKGDEAVEKLKRVVGSFTRQVQGDTLRGTYGDYLEGTDGRVEFFEPAVLIGSDPQTTVRQLKILAEFADSDGGILEDAVKFAADERPETTLVIIKPDSFEKRSLRPGNIIDVFSRTGLFVVGAKLLRFSVTQAEKFYGPLREMFVERLRGNVENALRKRLGDSFDFDISPEQYSAMAEALKNENARCEFNKIVEYMSGRSESTVKSPEEKDLPGSERGLALLYRGVNAIHKIRERLGSTDPAKAAAGTVRSEMGYDLMKNGAHASDSLRSAQRERKIVGLWPGYETPDVKAIIEDYLAQLPAQSTP
ncbi:MAG: nucleoside-diphosphate kinase [Planctomycetota bacterium]|jgi:nucleoside diphosphate kinase